MIVTKIINRVITPITVVKIPVFLDLVQPDNEISIDSATKPIIKVVIPIILGSKKSFAVTFSKYPPSVVIIKIFVIAKTETRKQLADIVAVFSNQFVSLLLLSETIMLATIAIEKPPNNALINMV